jgi:hypothetical protein
MVVANRTRDSNRTGRVTVVELAKRIRLPAMISSISSASDSPIELCSVRARTELTRLSPPDPARTTDQPGLLSNHNAAHLSPRAHGTTSMTAI